MTETALLDIFPDHPLPGAAVTDIRSHEAFDQVVAVRGRFVDAETILVSQVLLNKESERLVALSYWPAEEWQLCFDSADGSFATSHDIYLAAHEALDAVAPPDWGQRPNIFHNSLPDRESDIDSGGASS